MSGVEDEDIKFTERLRKVLWLSRNEATRLGQFSVGSEHLLLGLVYEEEGIAPTVLLNLGVDLARMRVATESMGRFVRSGRPGGGAPYTEAAQRVLEMAIEECKSDGLTHVGGNHLLLGLLREDSGVAVHALREQGIECEDVREETRRLLRGSWPGKR